MQDIIVPPLNKEAAEIVHKNWQAAGCGRGSVSAWQS